MTELSPAAQVAYIVYLPGMGPTSRRRDCHFDGTHPVPLAGVSIGMTQGVSSQCGVVCCVSAHRVAFCCNPSPFGRCFNADGEGVSSQ